MKEATGELNMTVITVVAIAAVAAFATFVIIPAIRDSITRNTECANAICPSSCTADTCTCTFINPDNTTKSVVCKNPNK